MGGDLIELALGGLLLGWVFAMLHRAYLRRQHKLWLSAAYIWMVIWSHQSFRARTLFMLPMFVQQFLPAILMLELLRRSRRGPRMIARPKPHAVARGVSP